MECAARYLSLSPESFLATWGEEERRGWILLKSRTFPPAQGGGEGCVFLGDDLKCSIYDARPLQCRTYPYWPRIMHSRETWEAEKVVREGEEGEGRRWDPVEGGCEGIEHADAGVVDFNKVRQQLLLQIGYNRALPGDFLP